MTDKINFHDPRRWHTLQPDNGIRITYDQLSGWTAKLGSQYHTPLAGEEPNAFHRLMQRLVLGIRWERTERPVGGIDKSSNPYWRNAGSDQQ